MTGTRTGTGKILRESSRPSAGLAILLALLGLGAMATASYQWTRRADSCGKTLAW